MASVSQINTETEQEPMVVVNDDIAHRKPFPIPTHIKLSPKRERERILQTLVHTSQCKFARCYIPDCRRLKKERKHLKTCKTLGTKACKSCKRIIRVCFQHAKLCLVTKCPMPFCFKLKQELKPRDQRSTAMETTQTKYSIAEITATILESLNVDQEDGNGAFKGVDIVNNLVGRLNVGVQDFQKICESVRKRVEGITEALRMSTHREKAHELLEHIDKSR